MVDLELSVGDFVVSGGEIPALVVIDAVLRLLPGAIEDASTEDESFSTGLLEYPQWTRPPEFRARAFDTAPEVAYSDELYHAEPAALMDALRKAQGETVMMIAHNPGIAFFAQGLVSALPGDARFERYPTAATAVIDFDAPAWTQVAWSTGTVTDLAFARDLT